VFWVPSILANFVLYPSHQKHGKQNGYSGFKRTVCRAVHASQLAFILARNFSKASFTKPFFPLDDV
jgi:uncharacterized PurR-regulated membrane protein YhhQ (DUF165 family)